jgi:hypothetical protein
VAWNGLQHGSRSDRLPEKLLGAAGDGEGQALYRWFQAEITATFGRGRPQEERWADQIAVAAWCRAPEVVRLRAKPECPLVSWALCSRLHLLSRIQVEDWRRRMGLAFWVQRPRYGTRRRQVGVMQGEDLLGTPPRGAGWNSCWRRQRFRSHPPSPWERVPFPGTAAVTPLRVPATQVRTQEITQNPEPRLLRPARESQA